MADRVIRTEMLGRRLSRRRALRGASLAGAGLAATLVACGGRQPSGGAASTKPSGGTTQAKKGGALVHAGGGSVGSYDINETQIDPHINTPLGARGYRLMFQGLLGYDPHTYAVQPELAAKWEQTSPTEIIFHLQPGVKWQNKAPVNGRLLVADDIVFSLNRVRSNDPRFTQ